MKKLWIIAALLVSSMTLMAERVTPADAALVADHFMNAASSSSMQKAPAKRMVLKQAGTAEENRYYLYQNENGEGWVIIAADDAVSPVLAYSETGHFSTENMPANVRKWMSKYNHFIQKIEADGVTASEETAAQWQALRTSPRRAKGDAVVGPLIKTQWDQESPYWDLCPGTGKNKAYVGCVATAMAQVMKFWEWPVTGTGSHSYRPLDPNNPVDDDGYYNYSTRYTQTLSANFGQTTYDWSNMLDQYTGSATAEQKEAVATLMYHCGVATEMMYGNDADGGSGTYTVNYGDWEEPGCAQNAFVNYFRYKKEGLTAYVRDGYTYGRTEYYKKWTDDDWTAMIKEELDKKHPILYGGASEEGGHSFICDGYDNAGYFHFNWGWSGENDGYFLFSRLKPGSGGAGGGGYDFSEDQDVIIGIVPDKGDMPAVTITWSVNGNTTTSEFAMEEALVLPAEPESCNEEMVFVGWSASQVTDGQKPADLFRFAGSKVASEDITYYAVFAKRIGGEVVTTEDVLTAEATGVTGNTYDIWQNLSLNSSAVYAGNSAGGNDAIQLRSRNSNSGIITTASGGTILKVQVSWEEHTLNTRVLDIYGSNTAYTEVADLYNDNKGTKIGSLTFGETEVDILDEYQYVGIRSNDGAMYLKSITLSWSGAGVSFSNYTTSCSSEEEGIEDAVINTPFRKIVRDGQLIIIRDNEQYNVLGQKIK